MPDPIEEMGLFFAAEGFPRIGGRIFGFLLLSEEASSLDAIARALGVSKASASVDTRFLERRGLVERVSRPGDRRVYYRVVRDLPARSMVHRMERIRRFRSIVDRAAARVAPGRPGLRLRLNQLVVAYDEFLALWQRLSSEWEKRGQRVRRVKRAAG
jgi:DNA-binding transcriptional ArsR family regulator